MAEQFKMSTSAWNGTNDIYGIDYSKDFELLQTSMATCIDWLWKKLNGKEIEGYPVDEGNMKDIYATVQKNNVLLNNINKQLAEQNELLGSIDSSLKKIANRI